MPEARVAEGFDLKAMLNSRQAVVDSALRKVLSLTFIGSPETLQRAIEYSLFTPGKRLRPILVILACEIGGGTEDRALPAACAVEMIHTYSLIHDDLPAMDDDDLRRGMPTSHKKFGEATAILAGDALLTHAFQVLAESYPPKTAAVSCLELAQGAGAAGMVGGQVMDLAAEGKIAGSPPRTVDELESIHRRKTGALFRTSLRLGLIAAQGERPQGPDSETLQRLDTYSRAFGLAFQIVDDLLDVQGEVDRTGKRVGKDAVRGKLTYPGLLGIEESRHRAQLLVREAVEALEGLGAAARSLQELARFVMDRDR